MTKGGRWITLSLTQQVVDFALDEDIASVATMTLEEATLMVNEQLLVALAERTLTEPERDELARQVIHTELVSRYEAEKARRTRTIH